MKTFSKATHFNKLWILSILFVACLFMAIGAYAQSPSKIEVQNLPKQAGSKGSQDFKMVAEVLDAFGGKSESADFKIRMSAGGQPSPFGKSQNTSFKTSAGYVWSAFVLHGNLNADGIIDIADVVYLINYIWIGGPEPAPLEAGDTNCDGIVDLEDLPLLIDYLFQYGSPPCNP